MYIYKIMIGKKVVDVLFDVEDARDSVRCIRKYEGKNASFVREYVEVNAARAIA